MSPYILIAFASVLSATSIQHEKAIIIPNVPPYEELYKTDWIASPFDATTMARMVRSVCSIEDFTPLTISGFRAVDLDGDSINELVVAPDQGCTGCPAMLVIFRRDGGVVKAWKVATENGDVDQDVTDVNGDSIPEIKIRKQLAWSLSHAEAIFWTHLYRMKEGQLIRADRRYKEFYRNLKKEWLETQRQALAETPESVAKRDGRDISWGKKWIRYRVADCQIGIDKVDRLLGAKKAGFQQAVEWWNSEDKALMRNAITTFEEIRDATCVDYLKKAARSPDPVLSDHSKSILAGSTSSVGSPDSQ